MNTVSVHQFYIGEWGGKGEQVGSMNEEPQVRGCYKAKSYNENTLFFFSLCHMHGTQLILFRFGVHVLQCM